MWWNRLEKLENKVIGTGYDSFGNFNKGLVERVESIVKDLRGTIGGKAAGLISRVVKLENVELLPGPGRNTQKTFQNKSGNADSKISLNFHWYVFRAKATRATLTVSDWANTDSPGAPAGTHTMFNFIEIQPYLE